MKNKHTDIIRQNNVFGLLGLGTMAVLSIPLVAMQFTTEVQWTLLDFVVMGALLFGMGSIFVFLARKVQKKHRLVVGLAVLAAFLIMWVHLAVGIVDTWPLAGS